MGWLVVMQYRKDIQILRGVSVLLVVLFHLQIGGMQSGYLGVDIFFVISGFLMATLYRRDRKTLFFQKRAKRLLPAYFATILITLVVSALITVPVEFNQVVKQSTFATFFSSNIGFWFQNSYFSKAEFNPLLHLWSLGVEIQFYLLVPFFYWFFRRAKIALPLVILFSIVTCGVVVSVSPKTSFFMLPFRLWEFLFGYSAAILSLKYSYNKKKLTSYLSVAALLVVGGIPAMNVDGQALGFVNGHPGLTALCVCLATTIILLYGLPRLIVESKVGRFFELAGKYSYSIYLVHFPVIVLFLYEPFSGTMLKTDSVLQQFTLCSIIIILSLCMYHFVESPARFSKNTMRLLFCAPLFVGLILFAGHIFQQSKYSEKEMFVFSAWTDRSTYRCGKIFRIIEPNGISCLITKSAQAPVQNIMLVGNSHADSIKTAFASVAEKMNTNVRFIVVNNPLMIGAIGPVAVLNEALAKNVSTIVLHYSPNAIDISVVEELIRLADRNNIIVSLIMPVPTWDTHIPKALYKNIKLNEQLPSQLLSEYAEKNRGLSKRLAAISYKNFFVYEVGGFFCQSACRIVDGSGKPYYFDSAHLTLNGSSILRPLFHKIVADANKLIGR